MRLLLDTHALLWWAADDERLPARARRLIASARNRVFVSAVSAWELAVKSAREHGARVELSVPVARFVPDQLARNGFEPLPVSIAHALAVADLPHHHADPFDRLLVAQAMSERMTLVSGDERVRAYPVRVAW